MPFVRISLPEQFSADTKSNISTAVHHSLITAFNVPEDDYFHIIEDLRPEQMRFPQSYLGVEHTADIVFVQITAAQGRSVDQKRLLYKTIADKITATTSVTKNNVIIILNENDGFQNWSFGNGEIQEPKHLKK